MCAVVALVTGLNVIGVRQGARTVDLFAVARVHARFRTPDAAIHVAAMTAQGVATAVGPQWGTLFWYLATLLAYGTFGLAALWLGRPEKLLLGRPPSTTTRSAAVAGTCSP